MPPQLKQISAQSSEVIPLSATCPPSLLYPHVSVKLSLMNKHFHMIFMICKINNISKTVTLYKLYKLNKNFFFHFHFTYMKSYVILCSSTVLLNHMLHSSSMLGQLTHKWWKSLHLKSSLISLMCTYALFIFHLINHSLDDTTLP